MSRPRLLDLFCCEGGAATGYDRAGFDVTGVDNVARPRFPFPFLLADALDVLADVAFCRTFDVIHASPPCQAYSHSRHSHQAEHPELIEPVRAALSRLDRPYVIENVTEAPLTEALVLCGAALGCTATDDDGQRLVLKRHRLFESNRLLLGTPCACAHYRRLGVKVAGVYRGGSTSRQHAENVRHGGYTPSKRAQADLMGMPWATRHGLAQAIPPVYTEHIGAQLL